MSVIQKRAIPLKSRLLDMVDFDKFWDDDTWMNGLQYARVPATNIHETKDNFVIEMAAPGLAKEDFHVDMKDDILQISVEKEQQEVEEKKNYRRREYGYYSFNRSFTLPPMVKTEDIKATYNDGILRLMLPKTPEAKKQSAKEIRVL